MGENKTNAELDYIVWQYLQKETPSLAAEFQKLKNLETKTGAKITLNSIYDIYSKNKPSAAKRQNDNEITKPPVTKKVCLHADENGEEDNTTEKNENENATKLQTNKDEKSTINEKPDVAQKTNDKEAKSADKKPLLDENNSSAKDAPKGKHSKSGANNKKRRKALLPKPKRKKTLLAAPFTSLHQNDPNFFYRDDARKALLPEPSPLIPTVRPSGRKTLLAEPLYKGRNERRPLLSDIPPSAYSEDERGRKTLLSEPLPLLAQNERAKKPLLMEPVPPPPLMQETARRIDRMGLLSESPPLTHLYPESGERMAFPHYPSMSDQLDAIYRRERKSLLDEPPMTLQDYLKKREALLIDPKSERYFDSRERKVGLLSDMPLHLDLEDMNRKKRALLSDKPPPLSRREYAKDPLDSADSSDHHLYSRRETSSLPKPLFSDNQEYDESSHLYSRRAQAKELTSDSSQWKGNETLLNELKNYLKKHLSCSPERISNTAERSSLLEKPIHVRDYEEIDKHSRMSKLSRVSPDPYAYYMQEKKASMARKDYYQMLPESLSFTEKAMADKSGVDFTREEIINRNEVLMRKYEEELKAIGINVNSEINSGFRRISEKDFRSLDQDAQRRSYERYAGKMGFL